jgi:hypothetical protein
MKSATAFFTSPGLRTSARYLCVVASQTEARGLFRLGEERDSLEQLRSI